MSEATKEAARHPWEIVIKDANRDKFKWAHNSINNPQFPVKTKINPVKDLVKFTVIGNRTAKEFIYCTHFVKTLYKYRKNIFDAPVIRGVTSVEWPKICNDLKLQYGGIAYCLENDVAIILNDKFLGGDKELKEVLESRYNYHMILDYQKEAIANFADFVKTSGRPCAYMHIAIDDQYTGSLIFMLYSDIVPYTCENFFRLCQNKRGGYSGTPVHRIVKDGWIQCGGFGLKSSELNCENFIIPHDRRGLLCMANDGRHKDCSTQFFVLLQPAPWMAYKYVAFGQLIDGESTLKAIESVPTFYESPLSKVIIEQTGVLNLEYQDIIISKHLNEYLQGHIEDLVALGDIVYAELLERVFNEIEFRRIALQEMGQGEAEEGDIQVEDERRNIRPTERFIRKKEDLQQLQKSQTYNSTLTYNSSISSPGILEENKEFDVEVYEYEPEESYHHLSIGTPSLVVKPEKPFYIAFTDVPYPGETDSTYDLKKFLRGDYCLESDLLKHIPEKKAERNISFESEIFKQDYDSDMESVESLSSEDEEEIRRYLKLNVDRVSFAGGVIRNIARGVAKLNIFENTRKSDLITDEELRRFRVASMDRHSREAHEKKVSISVSSTKRQPSKIRRRQTGFVRTEDLAKVYLIRDSISEDLDSNDEDDSLTESRKVRIAESAIATQTGSRTLRKPTGFPRGDLGGSDAEVHRKSALSRLYNDLNTDSDEGPTLKHYRPSVPTPKPKLFMLTQSPLVGIKEAENIKGRFPRQSIMMENSSFEQVLTMQHGRKTARKISSDYVKTIDEMEHRNQNSIRSVEYAKTRPSLSVSEYQQRNLKQKEEKESAERKLTVLNEGG